jgi:hypothetical protein
MNARFAVLCWITGKRFLPGLSLNLQYLIVLHAIHG